MRDGEVNIERQITLLKELRLELDPLLTKANNVSAGLQMNLLCLEEAIERLEDGTKQE